MEFTQEQLEQLKRRLPENVISAITSFEYGFTVEEICGKYNLYISETDAVYKQVIDVVIGQTNPSQFEENLVKVLPDQDKADIANLVKDLDDKIFKKIKDHVVKAYNQVQKTPIKEEDLNKDHRDQLLAEIEDPHPVIIHTISKPILENKPDIISQKLESTVPTTPQINTIELTKEVPKVEETLHPKIYAGDPYREPIK